MINPGNYQYGEKIQTTDGETATVGTYYADIDAYRIWYADGYDELVGPEFLHKLVAA